MRVTTPCIRCGTRGRTLRDPSQFLCRSCMPAQARRDGLEDPTLALRGGRWVAKNGIQVWVANAATPSTEVHSHPSTPPVDSSPRTHLLNHDHRNTDEKDAA